MSDTTTKQAASKTSFAWHAEPAEMVLEVLDSSASGLSSEEAARRLNELGPNILPRQKGPGPLKLLWRQINDPLIYVLIGAAVIALLMGKITDAAVVLGVVVLNMIVGFIQEYKAGRAIEALVNLVPNILPRQKGPGPLKLLWRQINDPLIYVLIGAAVIALLMGKITDAAVVLGVVVLNMIVGFIQEYKAGRAIEALVNLVPNMAVCFRDGEQLEVPAQDLVPGDVISLQPGDRVPADARLLHSNGLFSDEASLTGESVPAEKTGEVVDISTSLGDRTGVVFGGTVITSGVASAVVVETAGRTELGRISRMLGETSELETPLTRQMAVVGTKLTVVISVVAVLLMLVGLLRGETIVDALLAAITLAVAAIPEGLPAIITIALAIGVQRMARRRAIIRKLPAVETLGSTTVICTDKTGTLTRGEMTVRAVWAPGTPLFHVEGSGYAPEGYLTQNGKGAVEVGSDVRGVLAAGVLCNDSSLGFREGQWKITGDPTEGALLVVAAKAKLDSEDIRRAAPRVDAIPFESRRQYMATLHADTDTSSRMVVYMKGAPEVVVKRCVPPGAPEHKEALEQAAKMAEQGLRVLAFARKTFDSEVVLDDEHLDGGFTLLGLQGMSDPPRQESIEAIRRCRRAGIEVKMITGDHRVTAQAIGREIGLSNTGDPVVTGDEIEEMTDEELAVAATRARIFARVAPEHKLRLVRALQSQNEIVAMTGDGVNDAPALKQSNIGVAMGIAGTSVSKEAADMVLADDNFASIAAAVEEGRRVYDNLVKSLAFVLPTNIGEALIILIAVAFFPVVGGSILMPMLPVQILWINLVAAVTLALPLAFESMEPGVMRRRPRDPGSSILNRFVMTRTLGVAILMTAGAIILFFHEFSILLDQGNSREVALAHAQTAAVTTVILFQIFYLLQCRSLRDSMFKIGLFSNPSVYVGIVLLILLQLAFVYVPFMNTLFSSAPLTPEAWLKATLAGMIVLPVISLEKWLRRRHSDRVHAVAVDTFARRELG